MLTGDDRKDTRMKMLRFALATAALVVAAATATLGGVGPLWP